MNKRERLGSRLGFIMLSAGCAIGCGNVWKFPWMCGQNGGGSFMLLYILCLLVLGLPAMVMELAVGRAAQASPIYMYQRLEKPGHKWGVFGVFSLIGNIAIMAFYTVVTGWILYYFVKFLTGDNADFGFAQMLADPKVNVTYLFAVVVAAFVLLSFNLQGGLERVTKYMMTALLVLMLVLAIHSLTFAGAAEGLRFYLVPDFSKINGSVIVAAMNQAFFSLSVGMGGMAIFGSYIGKERSSWASRCTSSRWTPLWRCWRASSSSRPASPTGWKSLPGQACCLTRWPVFSTTWPGAAGGAHCSFCSWCLRRSPPCWASARTSWPWCAS